MADGREEVTYNNTSDIRLLLPGIKDIVRDLVQKDVHVYTDTLLLLGILNRTYELTESVLWAIENNRPLTAFNLLRALFETLGFTYYSMEKLNSVTSSDQYHEEVNRLLFASRANDSEHKAVNILTCMDCASKTFVKIREQYDNICETVHPNAASHFYCAKVGDDESRDVEFRLPFYEFKNQDKLAMTNMAGECCSNIQALCKTIISQRRHQ